MSKRKRMRYSPHPGGSGLFHFEGGFPKVLRKWIPVLEVEKKEDKGGLAVNPTSMNVVCFSRLFCACLFL